MGGTDEPGLEGSPEEFEAFLAGVRASDIGTVFVPLLSLLAWAKEPVPEEALEQLLSTHPLHRSPAWAFALKEALFYGGILQRQPLPGDGEMGWLLPSDALRAHVLASETMRENRAWALRRWLEVCAQWRDPSRLVPSLYRYALRHCPEHLLDGGEWAQLFALACDAQFLRAQEEVFPHDPDLPLRTIRVALQGAIKTEDPGAMVEFLLKHVAMVERLDDFQRELARGGLARVSQIARLKLNQYYPLGILWYLRVAWECLRRGDERGAEHHLSEVLRWVEEKADGRLSDDLMCGLAALLFSQLYDLKNARALAPRVLHSEDLKEVVIQWVNQGKVDEAWEIVEAVGKGFWGLGVGEIYMAFLKVNALGKAWSIIQSMDSEEQKSWALQEMAEALAQAGKYTEALKIVHAIADPWRRDLALLEIAKGLGREHLLDLENFLKKMVREVENLRDSEKRVELLCKAGEVWFQAGMHRYRPRIREILEFGKNRKDDGQGWGI